MARRKSTSFCQVDHLELRRLLSTIYVSSAATGGQNTGVSWTDAFTDLQTALSHASSGDVVAVAQGTYKPTSTTDRTATFHLTNGITIEGGFAGTGSPGPRDPSLYPTILSGDIGAGGNSDNSYHVVTGGGANNTAVLDGFTVTGGNANGSSGNKSDGGGIFNYTGSPTINDCVITGNAAVQGAGVFNRNSTPILTNSVLSGNTASDAGGGLFDYSSSPTVTNCIITGNVADFGGGVRNFNSSPILTNCVISANTANANGGGVFDGSSSPKLTNCTISGNSATGKGGGMYGYGGSSPILTNCVLWGNTAGTNGNEISNGGGGFISITNSDIDQTGISGTDDTDINLDPQFIRAVGTGGPDDDFGNLRLQSSSPAIAAGDASASGLTGITTDLDGLSRTINSQVDMGAYEAHYAFQSTVFVDASATGANTGSTWANAYSNLAVALDYAVAGEIIDVAQGTYYASTDASRFDTFQLVDGVILQGGFAGLADPNARDVSTYTTTLSGDIGTPGVIGDNTYNVVTGSGTDNTAILDGFTITAGYANGNHPKGGGIIDFSGSPTITDSIISGNTSTGAGAGMSNYQSSPILNDCTINGNTGSSGAGMANEHESSPVLTDCTISGNSADRNGGGIYNASSSPTLVSCTITGNTTSLNGGGIGNYASSATLTNCTLSGNTADSAGGGMYDSNSSPALTNCTFSGNSAIGGGGIFNEDSSSIPILTNCILWDDNAPSMNEIGGSGSAVVSFSDIDQSGFAGSNNNIDADPMFVRNAGTNGASDFGDLNLKVGSPAVDVGSNAKIVGTTADINGTPRIINATVDMGASETRPIIYVDASATGTGDGTSFANAFTTLTEAISHETSGSGQSIDVAQGTYKPTTGTDRTASFQLFDGVTLEGGFAGDTTSNPAQRDVSLFPTILSGDIGTPNVNNDNSYHVVYSNGADSTASLDGFTITAGNASEDSHAHNEGGGIINLDGSPTISDCVISGNTAIYHGGGIYNGNASPILSDCTVSGNTSSTFGGGIYNQYHSSPILTNCIISGNSASNKGGGIYNNEYSSPTLTNCIISGNSAAQNGGGIENFKSSPTLVNCTISGNTSGSNGDGMYSHFESAPTIINSIIWDDIAGNEIDSADGASVTITFSDINPADIVGTANLDSTDINADPQFIRNVGTDGPDDFGDFHLNSTSPAINAGSNAAIAGTSTDLDGNARIFGGTVDMGAFEDFPTALVIFTQPGATVAAGEDIPVLVAVEDQYGDVIGGNNSNVTISFVSSPSGAALGGTSTLSDESGLVTFSDFFLTTPGSYTLLFSDGSLATATSNTFTVTPGAPASLTITQQPTNTTAGQTISSIQVQAKDQYGNLADGSSVIVTIASGPGTTLGGTTTLPTSGGVASFSNLSLTAAGAYTLSLSDGALAPVTSNSFTISPAAAAQLVITQQPANTTAGQTLPAVNVEVEDQFGNAVDGSSVTLSIASGPSGSILGGTLTKSTAANGIAAFDDLSLNSAGAYTLSASGNGLSTITSNPFTIGFVGPSLIFSTEPASAAAGAKLPAFTIETVDTSGTLITTGKSTITLTLSSNGKIYGSTKAKLNNGVATFKNLSLHKAGTYTLTASDATFASGVSTPFTISAGAAKKLAFNPQPANVSADTPFNVSVELVDKYANPVDDGSTINLVLGSHPKTAASLNLSTTLSDGSANFDVTLDTSGNYTLLAKDGKAKATSKKFSVI